MKRPWLPPKPPAKPKCKTCRGTGKQAVSIHWEIIEIACTKCGGKGFV